MAGTHIFYAVRTGASEWLPVYKRVHLAISRQYADIVAGMHVFYATRTGNKVHTSEKRRSR